MKQSLYISNGNRKMNLPTWSLPARSTCPGCTRLCASICYARKAEKAYPNVLPCRKRNLAQSKRSTFVDLMVSAIKAKSNRFFRIHESGDFYNQDYLEKWFSICRELPEVKFLAFTKSFHLDYSGKPANLEIVWSVFPDTKLTPPNGPRAYAGELKQRKKTLECPGSCDNCGMCWQLGKIKSDVHFSLH